MSNAEQRIELLNKPIWTYRDIRLFDKSIKSDATALKIKRRAVVEFNGSVAYGSKYVKTDSVLSLYGTTRENEIKLLRELLNEKLQEEDV